MLKPIMFSPEHLISDAGVIYSKRFKRPLKSFVDKDGYSKVSLLNKSYRVHRLVAITFIPNKNNLPQVHHKNSDRSDNRAKNLEWVSHKENIERIRNSNKKCPNCGCEFI